MATQMPAGKWQQLRSLTDDQGRFKMMAIDQRGSLNQAITEGSGTGESRMCKRPYVLLHSNRHQVATSPVPLATAARTAAQLRTDLPLGRRG